MPKRPLRPGRSLHGFTLVELLVVISIIALLIALLMPALGRSREMSRRSVCLSNLRGMNVAALQYATDWNGAIPVGYNDKWKQTQYIIRYITGGGDPDWGEMGWLWKSGLLEEPRWQYCPSNFGGEARGFDTPSNPWPPEAVPAGSNINVRSGYNQRPVVRYIRLGSGGDIRLASDPLRLQRVGRVALFADPVQSDNAWGNHDWEGVNAAYSDGSVNWVPEDHFSGTLARVDPAHRSSNNDLMLTDDGTSGVWVDLDVNP